MKGPLVQSCLGPGLGGPQKACREGNGCKTKHCWGFRGAGSVSLRSNWSRTPLCASRRRSRVPERLLGDETGPNGAAIEKWFQNPHSVYYWWAVPRVPIWVFFLPEVEVGLKSRNSGPAGLVPTLGRLQQLVNSPPCCL